MVLFDFVIPVPYAAPGKVILEADGQASLVARWEEVPNLLQNGVILGYHFFFRLYDSGQLIANATLAPNNESFKFVNLLPSVSYSFTIMAFTSKGAGPYSSNVIGTVAGE